MLKTRICAISLAALLVLLAGCSDKDTDKKAAAPTTQTTTTATTPTTSAPAETTPTTSTPPAYEPGKEILTVEQDHCGLHFKLDSSYTVGLEEENEDVFTFANDNITGTVTFGKLSELGNGAKSSEEYAKLLRSQYGEEDTRLGTSNNRGFYFVYKLEGTTTAECLYVQGEYAWLMKAESKTSDAEKVLPQIIGAGYVEATEIPVA